MDDGSLGQVSWDVVGFTQYSVDTQKLNCIVAERRGRGGKDMMQALFSARVVHSLYFWRLQLWLTVLVNRLEKECVEATA